MKATSQVLAVVLALFGAASYAQTGPQPTATTVIHAGRLIDGTSTTVRERVTIFITDDRITDVQSGFASPPGAKVIDLSKSTVMPGLIDSHTHITSELGPNALLEAVTRGAVDAAVRSTVFAKRTLDAGFTTIRNLGADGGADVALKRAINEGVVPGPRMWTARSTLSITGGHGDQGGLRHDLTEARTFADGIVDSPEEAAKAVRYQHKYGADVIKFTATGGVLSINDSGDLQQFSDAEMRTIVETTHLLGLKVAAHAHGKRGMEAAIRAGVDSIEHGTYLDDETIALFKKHGAYLVPTVLAGKTVEELAKKPGALHPSVREKAARIGPLIQGPLAVPGRVGSRSRSEPTPAFPRMAKTRASLATWSRLACRRSKRSFRPRATRRTCWARRTASVPCRRDALPTSLRWTATPCATSARCAVSASS
jgi:imidazolonepropionase-like amidohydrolase